MYLDSIEVHDVVHARVRVYGEPVRLRLLHETFLFGELVLNELLLVPHDHYVLESHKFCDFSLTLARHGTRGIVAFVEYNQKIGCFERVVISPKLEITLWIGQALESASVLVHMSL